MIAYSSLGIAFVGFFAWGHHMFVSGQSTLRRRRVRRALDAGRRVHRHQGLQLGRHPVQGLDRIHARRSLYVCGFLFFIVFGGMTGIAVATVSLDVHWHDTYFVVAHFHFIMVGATIMAFLAALHYWFPKMFGRRCTTRAGAWSPRSLIILGFNATFIPQFLLGNAGMPRRYYMYPERFQALNVASTAGASLLAFGFLIILGLPDLRAGERPHRRGQPVGLAGLRVGHRFAAAEHNFDRRRRDHRDAALRTRSRGRRCEHVVI